MVLKNFLVKLLKTTVELPWTILNANVNLLQIKCSKDIRHCVKSFQIRSFFWSVFSHIRTEYGDLQIKEQISVLNPNTGKYRSEETPFLDTFDAVIFSSNAETANGTFGKTYMLIIFICTGKNAILCQNYRKVTIIKR